MAKKDARLQHVEILGIKPANDIDEIIDRLLAKFGSSAEKEMVNFVESVGKLEGEPALYDLKNKEYEKAMIFSGGYDADIIRKACNWVNEHKELFGNEILEVGCDCGFMTVFLGKLFPNKHILAIDRSWNAIQITRKNVEKYGLTNVEFMCSDATKLEGRTFDTVFSMRTMHENVLPVEEDITNEIVDEANKFAKALNPYAKCLYSLVKDNGNLVSIERMGRNALFLAWLQSLNDTDFVVDLDTYKEIACNEVGNVHTFQALSFTKQDTHYDNIFLAFMKFVADVIDIQKPYYEGWDAKILYEYTGGELLKGIEVSNPKTQQVDRIVSKIHNADETCILCYHNSDGNVTLEYHDISEKDDIVNAIENVEKDYRKLKDWKVKNL